MRTKYFLISAFALVTLLACQREKEINNPNYDPETETVKTKLVLNIATSATTKQSAAEAQVSGTFRGMKNAYIMPIVEPVDKSGKILTADMDAADCYSMDDLLGQGEVDANNSHRVLGIQLPLKTNKLLFYGRAAKGTLADAEDFEGIQNVTLDDAYGFLENYQITQICGSADFRLGRRLRGDKLAIFYSAEKLLSGIFTAIMNTSIASVSVGAGDAPELFSEVDAEHRMPAYGYALSKTFTAALDNENPAAGGIGRKLTWADFADEDAKSPYHRFYLQDGTQTSRSVLEQQMCDLYKQMVTIRTAAGELRAGSGEAIIRIIQDLWTVLNNIRWRTPTDPSEALAKYFAEVVYKHIYDYFNLSNEGIGGTAVGGVSFRPTATIVSTIANDVDYTVLSSTIPSEYLFTSTDAGNLSQLLNGSTIKLSEFPYAFNLPRGGTHMAFDSKYFYYPKGFNTSDMGGDPEAGGKYNAESYYFPSELLYFGNSPIRTSNAELTEDNYPNGVADWNNPAKWPAATWTGNYVTAGTNSVAMQYNINYGVALLQTQVKFASNISTLKDNNKAVQIAYRGETEASQEQDKEIPLKDGMFKLTGIIIGGQSTHVGWDYLPIPNPEAPIYDSENPSQVIGYKKTDGFVFDKAIHKSAQTWTIGGTSGENYTVVFDNFRGTLNNGIYTPAQRQDVVSVALEFKNCTGQDFYGNHNLIRNEGYFYLIGQLNPNSTNIAPDPSNPEQTVETTNTTISYPEGKTAATFLDRADGYVVPPYNADGTSQKVPRVFIQDYTTKVTFVIGEHSLKSAYLTVPDLKATSMSLGLSVDMSWEDGLIFEVPLGH